MRRERDAYHTPVWLAEQIVGEVLGPYLRGTPRVLEPAAGDGVFVRAVRIQCPGATITAAELNELAIPEADVRVGGDFLTADLGPHDVVVGNPPFCLAEAFVRRSLEISPVVCFILRLGFLASVQRAALYREHPPSDVWVCPRRPSFTCAACDATDYCVALWSPRWQPSTPALRWLPLG